MMLWIIIGAAVVIIVVIVVILVVSSGNKKKKEEMERERMMRQRAEEQRRTAPAPKAEARSYNPVQEPSAGAGETSVLGEGRGETTVLVYCIIDIWYICYLYYEVTDEIIG